MQFKRNLILSVLLTCTVFNQPVYAQHSCGLGLRTGPLMTLSNSVNRHLIGFEKNAYAYYRFEPSNSVFGLQTGVGIALKRYVFPFDANEAFLRQNMISVSVMGMFKLKHNGARFLAGFSTGFLTYAQTELRSTINNYYFSNDYLNSLQHSNKFQIDVCLEVDQPIGLKQKFSVGLAYNQNVNNIITADFIYPYYDKSNRLTHLTVSKHILPLSLGLVLKYKII